MKKIFAVIAALFLVLSAQAQYLKEGDMIGSVGVGLGSRYAGVPITLECERGLKILQDGSSIGVGGLVSYSGKKLYDVGGLKNFNRHLTLAVTGTYHNSLDLVDNLDLFATVGLGYSMGQFISKSDAGKGTLADNYLYLGINVGTRYFFSDNLAVYAKVGYSVAWLELGVSYQFNR